MASESDVANRLVGLIERRVRFIEAQATAGIDRESLLSAQCGAIVSEIMQEHVMDEDAATAITSAITRGPWSDGQKLQLASALQEAVAKPLKGKKSKRDQQHCMSLERFFTAPDWHLLRNPNLAEGPKIHCIAHRMWRLGITCPAESTQKRAAAILQLAMHADATPSKQEEWQKKIKGEVKTLDEVRSYPHSHIKRYVQDPTMLPAQVMQFAYEGTDGPVESQVDFEHMERLVRPMPSRKSHKASGRAVDHQLMAARPQPAVGQVQDPLGAIWIAMLRNPSLIMEVQQMINDLVGTNLQRDVSGNPLLGTRPRGVRTGESASSGSPVMGSPLYGQASAMPAAAAGPVPLADAAAAPDGAADGMDEAAALEKAMADAAEAAGRGKAAGVGRCPKRPMKRAGKTAAAAAEADDDGEAEEEDDAGAR
ncbi:unnamed protein product, partial [Prorocentrum cordatum]